MRSVPEPLRPAPLRQIIRGAAWLVAWDDAAQSHVYRRDVDLTVEGDTVAAISPAGPADLADAVEIDGRGFAVLPGFIDIHAHPSSEPMLKGLTDEVGSRQLFMSSLYEYLPLFEADPDGRKAASEVALCELMQSGVTTVCDLSVACDDWLDTLGASGMRVYAMPMFRSGRWYTPNGHEVRYDWDEKAGRDGLDQALRLIDRARQHPSGRLDGALYPAQVDTYAADPRLQGLSALGDGIAREDRSQRGGIQVTVVPHFERVIQPAGHSAVAQYRDSVP